MLTGDPAAVDQVRSAVDVVLRKFRLPFDVRAELAQESMGRIYIAVAGGRFRAESSLVTYASNVAKYTCLEYLRRKRREARVADQQQFEVVEADDPERALLRAEKHRQNLLALAALSAEHRQLLAMIFINGLSCREVASRLGVSELAVRLRIHRCRLRLRDNLRSGSRSPVGTPEARSKTLGGEV